MSRGHINQLENKIKVLEGYIAESNAHRRDELELINKQIKTIEKYEEVKQSYGQEIRRLEKENLDLKEQRDVYFKEHIKTKMKVTVLDVECEVCGGLFNYLTHIVVDFKHMHICDKCLQRKYKITLGDK